MTRVLALVAAMLLLGARAGAADETVVRLRGADAHGQPFDLTSLRGRVVAITFASRYTHQEADRVNKALAPRAGSDVVVLNVIDLTGVPSLFKGYARRKVAEHENDQRGRILHIIDERSEASRALGVQPTRQVDILVVDSDGALRGRFVGAGQVGSALRLVDELQGQRAQRERQGHLADAPQQAAAPVESASF